MWRRLMLVAACLSFPVAALAHLCNDVFAQAKDNLVVKVDVRDGQLRIGRQASFRVYLLNTMDRDIVKIGLEVQSQHFRSAVKPSPTWKRCPYLKTVRKGGKKEYFEVALTRKPGVPDGKYKIGLRLLNPGRRSQVFKVMDMDEAAGICPLPKAGAIKIDGRYDQAEWAKSFLCTGFYTYERTPSEYRGKRFRFLGNVPARDQSRFRMSADKDNLYCCFSFQGAAGATGDEAALYLAASTDGKPIKLSVDRLSGKVSCEKGTAGVECKVGPAKKVVELKIPRKLMGVGTAKTFYANFTRTTTVGGKRVVTYWRANKSSVNDPIVYGQFTFAK